MQQADIITSLVHWMPIRYSGLVVETTNRCNAQCAMCYQSSGPKGSDRLGLHSISMEKLLQAVREAPKIETLTRRLHIAGGEAFLRHKDVFSLVETGKEAGFLDITVTTNAYWGENAKKAQRVADQLKEAGLTSAEISWDYWHLEHINPTAVSNALVALSNAGIDINLRLLTTKKHHVGEALELLAPDAVSRVNRITSSPVFRTGRAEKQIESEEIYESENAESGSCHSSLNLTINAAGYVSPCCAGFDQTQLYKLGNINQESIVNITNRMNRDPIIRMLVFSGPGTFLPVLEAAGISVGDKFTNMCQLCWKIFSNPEAVEVIKSISDVSTKLALSKMLQSLEELKEANYGQN
ncbi:radical SAM protein [Vibrio penaeicida]|uniref:Radical SAM core domain-containing protein n=1 Tax=Vibrio penaeicida TaxID=104609 RepID=A0AAV5NVL4_9VIBR|nr:radical SAM/SPASM domain-containing protein [Vibrio penaeicida]RTZ23723.1 radical SAM protein [Vibrio penaeicida]GLQ74299.1 hypothetical protein GCM10007932_36600 [Vibrio penaeicida]